MYPGFRNADPFSSGVPNTNLPMDLNYCWINATNNNPVMQNTVAIIEDADVA